MTTQGTGKKKKNTGVFITWMYLTSVQTNIYLHIQKTHTTTENPRLVYRKKTTHPGGLITHLHCLLHNTQVRTRCDKQVYTQLKPPKATNPIIAEVIAFN